MDQNPLIGIDPDDTEEVRIGGATFVVGVIDAGLWARLDDEATILYEAAKRRAIRTCAAEGLDAEEPLGPAPTEGEPDRRVKRVDFMAQNDPEFMGKWFELVAQAARLAVRGHSGFTKRDGTPFPFVTEEATVEGLKLQVVAPATLRVYRVNPAILYGLWNAVTKLQRLGPSEKKDSPPPPSATG